MFRNPFERPAVPNVSDENNPRVFLDLSFNGGPPERIVIELYANVVPKTAENFRALCTGEKGISKTSGRPLHYKGTVFHEAWKGMFARGGDLSEGQDYKAADSIYGGYFEDENFQLLHTEPGLLSMSNVGPNKNGSRFFITFAPVQLLDKFHVVFGKVIEGMPTVYRINQMVIPGRTKLSGVVRITDCGQISEDKGKKEESSTRASSVEREKRRMSDQVQNVSDENNPRVFLDLSLNGGHPERIVIELYANVVPKTAENFRAFCTGEKGISKTTGRPLHYKGSEIRFICKGLYAHGGDLTGIQDVSGGESIYGGFFEDENFQLLHTEPGLLSMGNGGPNSNGCRFCITFAPLPWRDRMHVVFGKVIEGMPTLWHVNEMGGPPGVVRVTDCGQISEDKGKKEESSTRASSVDERVEERTVEREKRRMSDQDEGFLRALPRQKVGDDSVKELSSQQIEWIVASICEISRAVGFNIPEYPDS